VLRGAAESPDACEVFVGERRGDKGLVPGAVTAHPAADHGGEPSRLQPEPAVLAHGETQGVFVEPDLQIGGRRIESPVDPGLGEEVGAGSPLGIEIDGQPWTEEGVARGEEQAGRGMRKHILLEIKQPAHTHRPLPVRRRQGQVLAQPVEKVVRRASRTQRCHQGESEDEESEVVHTGGAPDGLGAGTSRSRHSNSVQSSPEPSRRSSPRCSRASSRARFSPRP
jgi:hypothetical protein